MPGGKAKRAPDRVFLGLPFGPAPAPPAFTGIEMAAQSGFNNGAGCRFPPACMSARAKVASGVFDVQGWTLGGEGLFFQADSPRSRRSSLIQRSPLPQAGRAGDRRVRCSDAKLGYRTSRLDLLNPKSDYNRLWIEYIEEFGDEDDAVVVVEGAGREQVVPVLEELSTALAREDRLFHAVLHEVDLGKIRSKGLHYLSPEELLGIERLLERARPDRRGRLVAAEPGQHGRRHVLTQLQRSRSQTHAGRSRRVPTDLERLLGSLLRSAWRSAQTLSISLARDAAVVRHA